MSKPKGSQIHVSQAVPRSRYLLFSFLDTISQTLVSLSLMIKIAQFFEVEAGRQCRRQYSSCQSGQNLCLRNVTFSVFSRTLRTTTAHWTAAQPVPNHLLAQVIIVFCQFSCFLVTSWSSTLFRRGQSSSSLLCWEAARR